MIETSWDDQFRTVHCAAYRRRARIAGRDRRTQQEVDMADVARKLLVKPGDRVRVAGGAAALIEPLPPDIELVDAGPADVSVVFVSTDEEFRAAVPALTADAGTARAAWIAYPKKSSPAAGTLSRDGIREALDATTDTTTVTQIAIDD